MNIALWIVQVLLALAFGAAGSIKTFMSMEMLNDMLPWIAHAPAWVPRVAGVSELLGALGLVLPSITKVKPALTPLAAAGLALVMVFAAIFHVRLGDFGALPTNVLLGGLAGFVWWGRAMRVPISARPSPAAALP